MNLNKKITLSFIITFIIIFLIVISFYHFSELKLTELNSENKPSTNIVKKNDELEPIESIPIKKEKELEYITLPTCFDPYTSILDWKRQNNLLLTKASDYIWKVENDNFNLTHIVETEDTIYHINCFSDYQEKLTQWKNQCYFKPGDVRSSYRISDYTDSSGKMFYTDDQFSIIFSYGHDKFVFPIKMDSGIYYVKIQKQLRFWSNTCTTISIIGDKELNLDIWRDWCFKGYFSTTKPPQKPSTFNLKS
ncbi:MAG: hypothetical protein ACN23H_02320 [Candidatus Phytoplasma vitis]|nr:MAG: hypothetical protein M6G77_01570 [Candidatus Phytoplasma vitis]